MCGDEDTEEETIHAMVAICPLYRYVTSVMVVVFYEEVTSMRGRNVKLGLRGEYIEGQQDLNIRRMKKKFTLACK